MLSFKKKLDRPNQILNTLKIKTILRDIEKNVFVK